MLNIEDMPTRQQELDESSEDEGVTRRPTRKANGPSAKKRALVDDDDDESYKEGSKDDSMSDEDDSMFDDGSSISSEKPGA